MAASTRSGRSTKAVRMIGERCYNSPLATPAMCRLGLLGMLVALIFIAYYPFAWSPPRWVHNEVTRSADGYLRFGEMNRARSAHTPAWLREARRSGTIQIQLDVDPQSLKEDASMMMLASDYWHTDFAIGQAQSDLLVWWRRSGSDANGDPPYVVHAALEPHRWNSIDVRFHLGDLHIDVNGRSQLTEHLAADSLRVWSPGLLALGDEVHGGGPWQGQIRLAKVRTPGFAVNYLRPGALSIPTRYFFFPDRIEPFPPLSTRGQLYLFFEVLSFIPVGFLLVWARRPPMRPISAILLATVLSVALGAGKLLFAERREVVADVVMQVIGTLIGALLAWWLERARRPAVPAGP